MATWSSADNEIASGTLDIDITYPDGNDLQFECLSVGKISYEFDLVEDVEEAKSIGMIMGDCSLTVHDVASDGSSIYELLSDDNVAYGLSNALVNYTVTLELTTPSASTYTFHYYFTKPDVETDDLKRTTKIKLKTFSTTKALVSDYFNGDVFYSNGVAITTGVGANAYDAVEATPTKGNKVVLAADFLRDILQTVNSNYTFVLDSEDDTLVLSSQASSGNTYALIADDSERPSGVSLDLTFVDSSSQCFEVVGVMAALEGAIYGSGFNTNFFVNRLSTSNSVSISQDDVGELKVAQSIRQWDEISVNYRNSEISTLNFYVPGSKSFSYYMTPPTSSDSVNSCYIGNFNGSSFTATAPYITHDVNVASNAYSFSLGATGESKIELTVFGVDKIKPHQVFSLDSSFRSRYQGRTFRPTSLEYDLENDEIYIEAYQVA